MSHEDIALHAAQQLALPQPPQNPYGGVAGLVTAGCASTVLCVYCNQQVGIDEVMDHSEQCSHADDHGCSSSGDTPRQGVPAAAREAAASSAAASRGRSSSADDASMPPGISLGPLRALDDVRRNSGSTSSGMSVELQGMSVKQQQQQQQYQYQQQQQFFGGSMTPSPRDGQITVEPHQRPRALEGWLFKLPLRHSAEGSKRRRFSLPRTSAWKRRYFALLAHENILIYMRKADEPMRGHVALDGRTMVSVQHKRSASKPFSFGLESAYADVALAATDGGAWRDWTAALRTRVRSIRKAEVAGAKQEQQRRANYAALVANPDPFLAVDLDGRVQAGDGGTTLVKQQQQQQQQEQQQQQQQQQQQCASPRSGKCGYDGDLSDIDGDQAAPEAAATGSSGVVWKSKVDPKTKRMYYYNAATRQTTWTRPPAVDQAALDLAVAADAARGTTAVAEAKLAPAGTAAATTALPLSQQRKALPAVTSVRCFLTADKRASVDYDVPTALSFGEDERPVTLAHFEQLKVLGRGGFGKVVLARLRPQHLPRPRNGSSEEKKCKDEEADGVAEQSAPQPPLYAMKVIDKFSTARQRQEGHVRTERRVLQVMEHPFLVKLHFAFQDDNKLYLVQEYLAGGDLMYWITRQQGGRFAERPARLVAAEVLLALEHLHAHDVIYRDLKLDNVMLDGAGHARLVDFGLAKEGVSLMHCGAMSIVGTPEFIAPEVLAQSKRGGGYGQSCDWWSFGLFVCTMLSGESIFFQEDRREMWDNIADPDAPLDIPAALSDQAFDMVSLLLRRRISERLGSAVGGAAAVKAHPFFSSHLDWGTVLRKGYTPQIRPGQGVTHVDEEFERMAVHSPAVRRAMAGKVYSDFDFNLRRAHGTETAAAAETKA